MIGNPGQTPVEQVRARTAARIGGGSLRMAYETLVYEKRDGIGYVTVSRPEKLNSFTIKMWQELRAVGEVLREDPDLRPAGEDAEVTCERELQACAQGVPVDSRDRRERGLLQPRVGVLHA